MEIRLPPDVEQSILAAFNAGNFELVASQLAEAVLKSNPVISCTETANLPENIDIGALSKDVQPFDANQKVNAGCWPEEDGMDDFLTFVRAHRNEATTPTVER